MADRRGYSSYNDRDRHGGGDPRHSYSHSNGDSRSRYEEDSAPEWSWWSTAVSVVSMTMFVSWFGVMGILFSGLSYTDHKVGDYKRSRYKRWWAWCCAISGIIVTIIAIVLLMLVMYAINIPRPTFYKHEYWIPYWLLERLNTTPAP